ncbi:hypothetical protein KFE25_010151 [Diacronema lutheri]|uniref:VWFA domain-containing protein n=1 Tax=Diacronema lutheri TaxID=2081491 RepID=A0A8J6CEP0_DIALT|nr:hypothetical protein KFE25_010151 [Diacronema lutheri]
MVERTFGTFPAPATGAYDDPPPAYEYPTLALTATSEFEAVEYNAHELVISMASIRAAALAPNATSAARTPLELVAVIDVSGSMRGPKLELMKQALAFVVQKGLQAADSLAVVSFESTVAVELPFVQADTNGKRRALDAIKALEVMGSTNLSGGLLQGLDMVAQRRAAAGAPGEHGVTRCVILFTDGVANVGIKSEEGIVAAVQNVLPSTGPAGCAIFCFGFGSDHSEDMLRAISEASPGGQYFFVSTPDSIPLAFADALGGLVSVVAQNAQLTCAPVGGAATVSRVLSTGYRCERAPGASSVIIQLGDLYAEDEKDLLVEIALPELPHELPEPQPTLVWTLRYFDIPSGQFRTEHVQACISRPEAVPDGQPLSEAIEVQRMRMITTEALERAANVADMGDVLGGQAILSAARDTCAASPAAHAAMTSALMGELDDIGAQYKSNEIYRSHGRKATKMTEQAHRVQRSAMGAGVVWAKSSKMRMKARVPGKQ